MNKFEAACREWLKGCTCATPGKPWECVQCTEGLHAHLVKLVGVVDHVALLAKYMQLVVREEGVSFIDAAEGTGRFKPPIQFTAEEIAELRRIEAEG